MAANIYTIRKKFFSFPHTNFHVYDDMENVVLYSRMKAFKLKEDIRIYSGEDMAHEVLTIRARSVFDFGATYDIFDPNTGENVGALRRRALKSMLRDEWVILAPDGREIGMIQEDSMGLAVTRRALSALLPLLAQAVPQSFSGTVNGQPVFVFRRHMNPFVLKMDLDFTPDLHGVLDRRLGFAAGLLMSAIEGRQD
jgi:uncharacterized protein YxjI